MPLTLQIFSDYVCPFCLLAKAPLDAILPEFPDLEIEWMPFELRPFPTPTLRPEDPYLPQIWAQSVYPMAARLGVEIKLPSISPQPYTHLAFEGFQHAKPFGKTVGNAYNERILRAFFVENRDIGDVEVLSELAQEVGAGEGFREALERAATAKRTKRRCDTRRKLVLNPSRRWCWAIAASRACKARRRCGGLSRWRRKRLDKLK